MDMATRAAAALDRFADALRSDVAARPPAAIRGDLARGSWIYGAGEYGQSIAALLQGEAWPVLGFIDRRAGDGIEAVMGLPVRHPDAFTPADAIGRAFVGAVLNPNASAAELKPWARRLPFAAIVCGADLPDALGVAANSVWQGPRAEILANLPRLRDLAARLGDAASLDVLMGLLAFRTTGDAADHPVPDLDNQYYPLDLPGFDRPITFVDGGAYIGDSCDHLLKQGVAVDSYVAFEPDAVNLARLVAFVKRSGIAQSVIQPCGLADRVRDFHFLEGKGASSRIVAASAATGSIRCVALDETMPNVRPDFIKLDVEGAEADALAGMWAIVTAHRPRLAVCLYHKPADLWELPETVLRLYDRWYLRQHGWHGMETVLYAFPP